MTGFATSHALLLAVLAALGCARTLPAEEPVRVSPLRMAENEQRVVDRVIVVTDGSGTMYQRETFPEAKAVTQAFVAAMPDADARAQNPGAYEASLIGFGGTERQVTPLAPFDRRTLASAADELDILGSVRLGKGGSTPLHEVLGEVSTALQGRRGRTALLIVSDGIADSLDGSRGAGQKLVESYADELCIHTVHVGDDSHGGDLLDDLARATECGTARTARSVRHPLAFQEFAHAVFAGPAAPAVAEVGPCDGIVRLRGVNFAFDRAEITPDSGVVLDVAAEQLRTCGDMAVDVIGHTDSIGPAEYNQGLSERRADAVKQFLVGAGVAPSRMRTQGRGEEDPIASNETADGRAQNRRTELIPR